MVFILMQNWWHIEAVWYPGKAQKIRQVMDLIIDDECRYVSFDPLTNACDIHAYARNADNRELAIYVPKGNPYLRAVFNPLDFPVVDHSMYPDIYEKYGIPANTLLRQAKIELEYVDMNPELIHKEQRSFFRRILHRPTWEYSVFVRGPVKPEFYITAPLGWAVTPVVFPQSRYFGKFREGTNTKARIFNISGNPVNSANYGNSADLKNSVNQINSTDQEKTSPENVSPVRLSDGRYVCNIRCPKMTLKHVSRVDGMKKYMYCFDENIHRQYLERYEKSNGVDGYAIGVSYSIKPSNFATISATFQGMILLIGLIFIVMQSGIVPYLCEGLCSGILYLWPAGAPFLEMIGISEILPGDGSEQSLTWPILTTIATWITFSEINIKQERDGYYFPWRGSFKYLLLSVATFELILLSSFFLNLKTFAGQAVFLGIIAFFSILWIWRRKIYWEMPDDEKKQD